MCVSSLFLSVPFFLSFPQKHSTSVTCYNSNSHSVSAVKAVTVHYPCKCCRMITIVGRGRYGIILPSISSNCTLRNCLSLQNGLISHETPSVGLCRGVRKTDVVGAAATTASTAKQYIDFCTKWVMPQPTHHCVIQYTVIQGGPCQTYPIKNFAFFVTVRLTRLIVHSVQQKSIGLKFSKSRTGSDVRTVAIIIRVVLLSPYLRIRVVSVSSIHYNQSHRVCINRTQQYICLI